VWGKPADLLFGEKDPSFVKPVETSNDVKQGGLSTPVGTDKAGDRYAPPSSRLTSKTATKPPKCLLTFSTFSIIKPCIQAQFLPVA
jgi:hypothetical protein